MVLASQANLAMLLKPGFLSLSGEPSHIIMATNREFCIPKDSLLILKDNIFVNCSDFLESLQRLIDGLQLQWCGRAGMLQIDPEPTLSWTSQ